MKKDAYYFPHFSNARHDRKLKRVIKELGVEGYGIYFMILEVLREQPGLSYPLEDIDLLADEFKTSEPKVRTVIANYDLFTIDEKECFFSAKLEEYLEPYFKMKQQRIEAGKASAAKRKQLLLGANVQQPNNDRSTTVQQSKVKKRKVKEIKKENFETFYNLEIEKNINSQNIEKYKQLIQILKGEHASYDRFNVLLSLPVQLSYKAFDNCLNKLDAYNKHHKKSLKMVDIIISMEANGLKGKKDFSSNLRTFVNNKIEWTK